MLEVQSVAQFADGDAPVPLGPGFRVLHPASGAIELSGSVVALQHPENGLSESILVQRGLGPGHEQAAKAPAPGRRIQVDGVDFPDCLVGTLLGRPCGRQPPKLTATPPAQPPVPSIWRVQDQLPGRGLFLEEG